MIELIHAPERVVPVLRPVGFADGTAKGTGGVMSHEGSHDRGVTARRPVRRASTRGADVLLTMDRHDALTPPCPSCSLPLLRSDSALSQVRTQAGGRVSLAGLRAPLGRVREVVGMCRVCGCTDDRACVYGRGRKCSWVERDLCSSCHSATCPTRRQACELGRIRERCGPYLLAVHSLDGWLTVTLASEDTTPKRFEMDPDGRVSGLRKVAAG